MASTRTTSMPLRIELKPFERLVIGESVIVNSDARISFLVEGDAPVLRERDIMAEDMATTPARRLYHCVQTIYLRGPAAYRQDTFAAALAEVRQALPDSLEVIDAVELQVGAGAFYRALRDIR